MREARPLSLRTVERIGALGPARPPNATAAEAQSATRMRTLMFASALVLFLVASVPARDQPVRLPDHRRGELDGPDGPLHAGALERRPGRARTRAATPA